ncbi:MULTISPECIES: hypothetical protein [Cyanophyceae]|uniref:hypothetical protein n=1 Tax=Cyanophyceae TaxID=3028117 RepID=UPI001683449C|nr:MULTISPECIES: hypothetical protein [Cyanophyceae]MBD1918360.1 hypothetical protein [Phormidium sp. FACHB-77]MBD2028771.1 hypothetical protein [Phormidium sp. FACHB-322]MBD2051192.1 hypothetical protein [Leptolyngbya sp. FACHB-60]
MKQDIKSDSRDRMSYPPQISLKVLQAEHPDFSAAKPHLERIQLLVEGGWRLRDKLGMFLKQRPGEEDAIYEARLEKFAYSGVLGPCISQMAAKLTLGTIQLSNVTNESFWEAFKEDNNGQGRTKTQLIEQLFAEGLKYRTVVIHIDKPKAPVEPRSRAEEEQLGLRTNLVLYPAVQVPMWSESNGKLNWVKVFQLLDDTSDPLRKPLKLARWTYIDNEQIAVYESFVKLGSQGQIIELLDDKGEPLPTTDGEPKVPLTSLVLHGFGVIPSAKLELPDGKWSGNHASPKAEECLRLECHRYDLLTASYLQRTYTPHQTPDGDLGDTYVGDDEPLPTGLQYVLQVDKFEWSEPKGDIILHIDKALESAEKQIRAILGTGGAYTQEPIEASGISKEMDFEIEDARLESYGHILTDCLQDIYQLVAKAEAQDAESLAVSGLDEFGGDRLVDLIEALNMLLGIDLARLEQSLTPTLHVLIRERLLSLLMGNLTPEQRQTVLDEAAAAPMPEPVQTEFIRQA